MYSINSKIPIYFSFCIYGTKTLYYEGLLKNLDVISKISPLPNVLIGHSNDILEEYKMKYEKYNFVKLIKINEEFNEYTMCSRLLQLDTIERPSYVFCRDADSRVSERDIWCIQSFINSGCKLHIIRDHFYHKQKIMGGTCGLFLDSYSINFTEMFRKAIVSFSNINKSYGFDEHFLSNEIYNLFTPDTIFIHSNCIGLIGENINNIECTQKDDTDFIGNVYDANDIAEFTYSSYITHPHLEWLSQNEQWKLIVNNRKYIAHLPNKYDMSLFILNAALKAKDLTVCLEYCKEFEYLLIDENLIKETNKVLELAKECKYEIVATSDITRKPNDNEFVICYGQYPHSIECLPISRMLYRHPLYFCDVNHTKVEYNKCWDPVSTIYILNLEERRDRYLNVLIELCRVCAPLNRIFHYKAQKTFYTGNRSCDAYIGATNNHLDAVTDFIKSGNKHCLVLEDDITFISDTDCIYKSMTDFFNNPLEYDVCFLSCSKYGDIRKYNNLLSLSYQACTTSSAYFINSHTAPLVENCFKVGVNEMKLGKPSYIYCCDRYWAILQSRNKMFLFKRKLAFQTITHSDITNSTNYAFD